MVGGTWLAVPRLWSCGSTLDIWLKRSFIQIAANGCLDEGFSMRATAQGFGVGLTLARVDKPLKEEAVGC